MGGGEKSMNSLLLGERERKLNKKRPKIFSIFHGVVLLFEYSQLETSFNPILPSKKLLYQS